VTVRKPKRCAHPFKKRCQTVPIRIRESDAIVNLQGLGALWPRVPLLPRAGRRGYEVLAGCESSAYVAVYT